MLSVNVCRLQSPALVRDSDSADVRRGFPVVTSGIVLMVLGSVIMATVAPHCAGWLLNLSVSILYF